jgi:hypothetical protein
LIQEPAQGQDDLPMLVARRARLERLGVKDEYSFEVSWRRPERSGPPLDLLRVVGERYPIAVFELTSENGG